tara:strand:+ start:377 stop:577 length:201 start_codon:yes stop_codon:yes gene_type:complete
MTEMTTDPQLVFFIGGLVVITLASITYGIYLTFGGGSKQLRDTIDEHAKMHELGIAHGHSGQRIKK